MTQGFFSKKQTQSTSRPDGKVRSCAGCGLHKDVTTRRMKPYGEFKRHIMVIGEAPGRVEDKKGMPWQGSTGKLLEKTLRGLGIDLFEDCVSINSVHCRPTDKQGDNRAPTNYEIDCCRRITLKYIEEYQPNVILILGGSALYSILGHRWKRDLGGISKWRGFRIPDQDFLAWVLPTFHPSYVSRAWKEEEKSKLNEIETIWKKDLGWVAILSDEKVPRAKKANIEIISDLSPLEGIRTERAAIDYETTGIKPHAKGHRIVCASVAYDENNAYAFMMPNTRKERMPLIKLLANPNIGKMAHNMKYEENWSVHRLRQPVANWEWDSMVAAHVLDNRPGITSLKFQTYVVFGIVDYESDVAPYLWAATKDGNAINRIFELLETPQGEEQLLNYCGHDTIYEYRLALLQQKIMDYSFLPF